MIEDKEIGLKVAENPKEAMIENVIKNMEKQTIEAELNIEINKVVIEHLKKRKV